MKRGKQCWKGLNKGLARAFLVHSEALVSLNTFFSSPNWKNKSGNEYIGLYFDWTWNKMILGILRRYQMVNRIIKIYRLRLSSGEPAQIYTNGAILLQILGVHSADSYYLSPPKLIAKIYLPSQNCLSHNNGSLL